MKRMLFVYNPNAGKGIVKTKLSDIVDIFVKADYEVVVYPTQCYHDALHKVAKMDDGYDILVCSGGDGTLDEAVTGMMKRPPSKRIPIGYIPAGTTNDFANSLHISKDVMEAADAIVNGTPFACDVGRFNKDVFVYVAAFGLFTDVPYQTDQKLKNILGHSAYVLEGVKRLSHIPSYQIKITHGDTVIEDEFVVGLISNSRSIGGFQNISGKDVKYDDGEFEITLIKRPTKIKELQEILTSLLLEKVESQYVLTFKASEILLESNEEIPWTLDGEFGGQHSIVRIRNKKQALKIMVEQDVEE